MSKVFLVVLFCISFSALNAQKLKLVFYNSFNTHISNVSVAKDSTLLLNIYEELSNTEFVGKVFRSTDLGNNWDLIWKRESTEEMKPYYTYYWNYISGISKDTIVIFNSSGYISRTFDGGINWDSTNVIDSEVAQILCFKKKRNQIACVFERNDLLIYSNNYGETWKAYTLPTYQKDDYDPLAILLEGDDKLTVSNSSPKVTDDKKLVYEVVLDHFDLGQWVNQDTIYNQGITDMYKLENGDILMSTSRHDSTAKGLGQLGSYKLCDSVFNFKENWLPTFMPSLADWYPTIAMYGENILLTRQDTLWATSSFGAYWNKYSKDNQQPFPGTNLKGVDILENGLGLYMDDKSVYLFNPNPTSVNDSKTEDNSISIYPNPSSDFVSITSEEEGLEEIILFDVQGREVGRFDVGSKIQDVSYLESGTYYLRFSFKDKIKIRQLVIN